MTIFSGDPGEWQRLDWHLLQNGGVALYFRPTVLEEDLEWFRANRYDIYEFECKSWNSVADLHKDFKDTLRFPDYYGRNFDALNDCLTDLSVPDEGGAVIVLKNFDAYADGTVFAGGHTGRTNAQTLLHILARVSRMQLLLGHRLLALVQSNDPRIRFEHLGCICAMWNPKEWLNEKRGL